MVYPKRWRSESWRGGDAGRDDPKADIVGAMSAAVVPPPLHRPPLLSGPWGQRVLAGFCLLLGLASVWPLLAWVYGLGTFAAWFWLLALPGALFTAGTALGCSRRGAYPALQVAIGAGVLGGIAATIFYDIVRVPFLVLGYRLFAPISTYGILMTLGPASSPGTETLGWLYNFMNGTLFGVAYAMVGLGRRWWWAIPFALGLETMTVVTPYADVYGLRGKPDVIAIAYGAHVFYGLALGMVVQRAASWRNSREAPLPAWWAVATVVVVLVALNHPWTTGSYLEPASHLSPQPAAVVRGARFQPEWLRVPVGGCVLLDNRDPVAYHLAAPPGAPALAAHEHHTYCFKTPGTRRVQLDQVPYSGGWVLVDPAE